MKLVKDISFLLFIALFINACEEENNIEGCTNSDACNYNSDANVDDGSCILEIDCWDGSSVCDQNDCPEQPDTTDDLLVGSWNWISSISTLLNEDGDVLDTDTSMADSLNTWMITLNDDGIWSETRLDDGSPSTDSGTWSSSDGIITLTFDEEEEDHEDGHDDEIPQVDYDLSDDSNTLTMNVSFDIEMVDEDGNITENFTAAEEWVMERVE